MRIEVQQLIQNLTINYFSDITIDNKDLVSMTNNNDETIALAVTEKVNMIDFHKYMEVNPIQVEQGIRFTFLVTSQ